MTTQQVMKELEQGRYRPFYLVVGDEPFQISEINQRLKKHFVSDDADAAFNYEAWDGEHLDADALLSSLETLPGLFDLGNESVRLVSCSRFDKVSTIGLETLDSYFRNPSPTTCFLLIAAKADKRKAWYKRVAEKGGIIEVAEPYEREWPKWQGFFERKLGKRIEAEAWERLLESSGRKLSLLWAELQKVATYVGEAETIIAEDYQALASASGEEDVFQFAEDVVLCRQGSALRSYLRLMREGENEIKVLSILVRQFRLVSECERLLQKGVQDPKRISQEIGAHPYFVGKIINQAKVHNREQLDFTLDLLTECDFRLKSGGGRLFENLLVPYFERQKRNSALR